MINYLRLRLMVLQIFIIKLLNMLPIFHVSRDSNFGTIDELKDLRFSLLFFPFGSSHFYLFTYCMGTFQFFYRLRLNSIAGQASRTKTDLKNLQSELLKLDSVDQQDNWKLRTEFLKYKLSETQNGLNVLNNKVNSYIAIALVYVGLFSFLLNEVVLLQISILSCLLWFALFISGLALFNVLLLLKASLAVKGKQKSSFKSFKDKPTQNEFCSSVYLDWLTLNESKQEAASLVKNIELYFIRSFIFSISIFVGILAAQNFNIGSNPMEKEKQKIEGLYTLIDNDGKFSPEELLSFSNAVDKSSAVIFILSKDNTKGSKAIEFVASTLNLDKRSQEVKLPSQFINENVLLAKIKEKK